MSLQPRVLIVDDSAPFRRSLRTALETTGMIVTDASEGIEGLWRVRNETAFDLLVTDVHMPTMDGLTFIREVRTIEGYARTPVVVVTSDGSRERRAEARTLGIAAWLLKPPDMKALVKSIVAALYRGTPDDPAQSQAG